MNIMVQMAAEGSNGILDNYRNGFEMGYKSPAYSFSLCT